MQKKHIWAWASYDWANSAFATTVMAGFFPVFFKQFWNIGVESSVSTARLGWANSRAFFLVLLIAPFLGALADQRGNKKFMLASFMLLGVVCTGALSFVPKGAWEIASLCYSGAIIGFAGSIVFYDSLIVHIAPDDNALTRASSLGYGMGYLGGGVLFLLNIFMVTKPELFGLKDASEGVRFAFLTVALWWFLFSIPLFLFVPNHNPFIQNNTHNNKNNLFNIFKNSLVNLKNTLMAIFKNQYLRWFIVAYWLYIDGVDTIVAMAVDYGLSLGFEQKSLLSALLLVQFIGFPMAILFGKLAGKIGILNAIKVAIIFYIFITFGAYFLQEEWHFYALAAAIGCVQGGIQALSRAYFASLVPVEQSAEYFGFYNMLGKFAAVLGPALVAFTATITQNPRISMLSILLLFIAGFVLVQMMPKKIA